MSQTLLNKELGDSEAVEGRREGGMVGAEWLPVNFKFQFRLWCVRAAGAGSGVWPGGGILSGTVTE